MQTLPQTEVPLLRYDQRDYSDQEVTKLIKELEDFEQTSLYELFLWDVQVEIAEIRNEIEDDDTLTEKQVDKLRGKVSKLKDISIRFPSFAEYLLTVINQNNDNQNE